MKRKIVCVICPKGPRYSQVPYIYNNGSYGWYTFQVSHEVFAAWGYNAKGLTYSQKETSTVTGNLSKSYDVYMHDGLDFCDTDPYPLFYGGSGTIQPIGYSARTYVTTDLTFILPARIYCFAHRDNWYIQVNVTDTAGVPMEDLTVTVGVNQIKVKGSFSVEVSGGTTETLTLERKWAIIKQFH